ncbi:MAG: hypothetical protein ACREJN_21350 [Nitrospiraceae bacterium]
MIPYRPNQSPQSWMYIGAQQDYRKYSAPDVSNTVIENLVGIEEQQNSPEACPNYFSYTDYFGTAGTWVNEGNAGVPSDGVRLADTAGVVIEDPASGASFNKRCSVQVTDTSSYQIGMNLLVGDVPVPAVVQDIYPAINQGDAITIEGIYYFSGTTGRCIIVPTQGPVSQPFQNSGPQQSIYAGNPLSALRRGSLVTLTNDSDTEIAFVLSVTIGPSGAICFEVETTNTYIVGSSITGVPAICLSNISAANSGDSLDCRCITYTMTGAGFGFQTCALSPSPFNSIGLDNIATTQQYDYVGFAISINDLARLVYVKFVFNIDPVSPHDVNGFYVVFPVSDFQTPDPSGFSTDPTTEYKQFMVPISSLIRFGSDLSKTLTDCNSIQIQIQCTDTITVKAGPFWVGIGHQPDVGDTGAPYSYLVRTRNSLTGAVSNPSPVTPYGVGPRRQTVRITMQDTNSDSQDDFWDVYRLGGSVDTFRYIGSTPITGGVDEYTDDYFDTAAKGGSVIEYDNFQPWPTIDLPFTATAGASGGITTGISVVGTAVIITFSAGAPFTDPAPATILRWLPGTVMLIDGLNAYTLMNRPVMITLDTPPDTYYYAYLIRITENAGAAAPATVYILEPNVANQPLPYLWGPDAEGTVFGAGDPFRPGTLYYCKSFNPDSAPDSYNQELTPPNEPLIGGETINGLSLAASTKRWWALYPNFGTGLRYQAVEKPVKRGLAAPYAHATDGQVVYFCAEDGIWSTEGQSLTEADLHNLFPHEGVVGQNYVYAGLTVYAPDYKYAAKFRLCYRNFYLYFDYRDSAGLPRTLVCDLRDPSNPAWCLDEYADPIGVHYGIEQQEGTLLSNTATYPALVMGDDNGVVHVQVDNHNDGDSPIPASVSTQEFNGGDIRSDQLFNDEFLDLVPISPTGVVATVIEGGLAAQAPRTIPQSNVRVQTNVPVGLELKYMGVLLQWVDDFTIQSLPTLLRAWQPMYQAVPVAVFLWKNQGTTFGMQGYKSLRQVLFAYKSTAVVTLTITTYDGQSPAVIQMPSTGGQYRKTMFPFTANKGMLYFLTCSSEAEWQPYLGDTEFYVGAWDRGDAYTVIRDIDAVQGIRS